MDQVGCSRMERLLRIRDEVSQRERLQRGERAGGFQRERAAKGGAAQEVSQRERAAKGSGVGGFPRGRGCKGGSVRGFLRGRGLQGERRRSVTQGTIHAPALELRAKVRSSARPC